MASPRDDGRQSPDLRHHRARAGRARFRKGVTQVKSPTGMVWVLGRIYCTGTPEDYKAVHALQDKFSVVPLSAYGKPYTPPPGVVDPSVDMKTAVRKQVDGLGHRRLFQLPRETDEDQPADRAGCPDRRADGQDRTGPGAGLRSQASSASSTGSRSRPFPSWRSWKWWQHLKQQKTTNGWLYFTQGVGNSAPTTGCGAWPTLLGPGWNRPQDAVYPLSQKDAKGDEYNGARTNT